MFAVYVFQFKRCSRSRRLMETEATNGFITLLELIALESPGQIFEIRELFCFYLHVDEFETQQKSLRNLKSCKLEARESSALVFGREGAEGA